MITSSMTVQSNDGSVSERMGSISEGEPARGPRAGTPAAMSSSKVPCCAERTVSGSARQNVQVVFQLLFPLP